jgi:hypothetical protein
MAADSLLQELRVAILDWARDVTWSFTENDRESLPEASEQAVT